MSEAPKVRVDEGGADMKCERCGRKIENEHYYTLMIHDVVATELVYFARLCPRCYEELLSTLDRFVGGGCR